MPDWLRQALQAIKPLLPKDFVGQVEVNIYQGGIANVNVKQSYKPCDS
jgi:hypothetical protein